MKPILPLATLVAALVFSPAGFAEESPSGHSSTAKVATKLTTFDLDFPGGTPNQLVDAMQKASNRPLNAIVPPEYSDWHLPPLKLKHVTAAELFGALERMSVISQKQVRGGIYNASVCATFKTGDRDVNDDSVWYFWVNGPVPGESTVTRYYRLTPYLENGLSVDDVTTAIQTGWKMSGQTQPPKLSFHKETGLLIAVGTDAALENIDAVLRALEPVVARPKPGAVPAAEKPAEKKS